MKFLILIFLMMFGFAQASPMPGILESYRCDADLGSYPLFGTIKVQESKINIQQKKTMDEAFVTYSLIATYRQTTRLHMWKSGTTYLAIARKKSSWGDFFSGTYSYFDNGIELFVPLWCYGSSQN